MREGETAEGKAAAGEAAAGDAAVMQTEATVLVHRHRASCLHIQAWGERAHENLTHEAQRFEHAWR